MESTAHSLQGVLQELLKSHGMEHVVREASIPDVWAGIVGESAARHCQIVSFEQSELKIKVDSSVWRSELKLRHDDLLAKLNEGIGAPLVQRITFR